MKPKKSSFSLVNNKYDYVKNSKWYWIGSGVIVLVAIVILCFAGINLGLDFTGGNIISVKLGSEISTDTKYTKNLSEIDTILKANNITIATAQKEGKGDEAAIVVKFQNSQGLTDSEMDDLVLSVRIEINKYFGDKDFSENMLGEEEDITIGSDSIKQSARDDLIFNACVAVLFAVSLMLLYVAIRFEALMGLSSILGLAHDVLIAFAFVIIFRIPINSSIIAAIITIIGYSINNSIITFDRIRENLKKPSLTNKTNSEITNMSIKQTLTRNINTIATTVFAVLMLALIGGAAVREFVIIIVIGILAGAYSSLFLVPEFWARFNRPRKLVKPAVETDNDEIKTNDVDTNAEVIEITEK